MSGFPGSETRATSENRSKDQIRLIRPAQGARPGHRLDQTIVVAVVNDLSITESPQRIHLVQ